LWVGPGCPKEGETTTSGATATATPVAAAGAGASSKDAGPPAPLVSEDGRLQTVDAYGYPMFNPDGTPIWEPTAAEKANQLFEEAVMLSKGFAGAPPNLPAALSRLRDALALKENFPEAHYNLGLVELEMGDLRAARSSFQKALDYRPEMREALLAMAITAERSGDLVGAQQMYLKGQALDNEDVDFLNGTARILRKQGRASTARDKARKILEINANSVDAYNTLGLAYLDLGEIELARFVFIKAENSVPGGAESPSIQANLGLVYFKKGDEFEAEARFIRAMALDPDHVGASVNLAYLKLQNYDFEGARDLLEKAHRRLPSNVPISLDLAVAYSGTGDFKRAEELYDGIAGVSGDHQASAIYNLGILYADKLKDLDMALEQYNKYIAVVESNGVLVAEDDPVHSYIEEVHKAKKREERRRKRDEKRKRKEEAKARKAAEEAAQNSGSGAGSGEPSGTSGGQEGTQGGGP
jgi:tetratricopeptide (TPR) repeat protein